MCLYPKLIKNRKYIANKKNGGNVPEIKDSRTEIVPIGCGKCIECMKQKKREWQVRMNEEIRNNKEGNYVTLTFSEESIIELSKDVEIKSLRKDLDNEIATLAVRRFLERWRKKYKTSVRHWLVTELGHNNTERIHMHGIIFNKNNEEIEKIWKYGHVWFGEWVNEQTINYIVKYINKIDQDHKGYTSKILCSKGIGSNYMKRIDSKINKYNGEETKEYYKTKTGSKLSLPKYYRNKIYTDEEREDLWINLLNKEERYVGGEYIDVSINDDEYNKALEYYREKNKRLGYGDDSKQWSKENYQQEREKLRGLKNYINSKRNKQV